MADIDPRSGFNRCNSTFYSKRKPISLPSNHSLDITTFISSHSHHGTIAFIDSASGHSLTFSDLWRYVESVSSTLYVDFGIRKGHVILLFSPNSIYFPIVCLAVMSLGAIITTTTPLNTTTEIAKQISDTKPVLAFTIPQFLPKIVDSNLPIVLLDSDNTVPIPNKLKIVTSIDKMMSKEPAQCRSRERVNQDDAATILYSSGTTGTSKGVVTSHRNLIATVHTIVERFKSDQGRQTFLCTVPMFHISGFTGFATAHIASGSTVVILSKFDMHETLMAIEKFSVTCFPLVPPVLVALINNADAVKKKYDLRSLRSVICGGAPLSKEVTKRFVEKYPGVAIMQGYGLTESNGSGATANSLEESRKYGTAGLLSPSIEAKIINTESGVAMPVNRTGELWLKGPCIMQGYFNNAEATASTLDSDGWLRTGDLCYIDEDGFLFVVDRLNALIKYKGYKVPPAELEALLLTHPEITDSAVIPFPDKEDGEIPMAYVVRREGSLLTESAVMDFVAKKVAPYMRIRRVEFVASVPKNISGKILRKDLINLSLQKCDVPLPLMLKA